MARLVVPTDFSPFAREALRYALRLARRAGDEVHLLHVYAPQGPELYDATPGELDEAEVSGQLGPLLETALEREAAAVGAEGELALAWRRGPEVSPAIGIPQVPDTTEAVFASFTSYWNIVLNPRFPTGTGEPSG